MKLRKNILSFMAIFFLALTLNSQEIILTPEDGDSGDFFGYSVAISNDLIAVSANSDEENGDYSGSVYIFKKIGNDWIEEAKLMPDDGTTGAEFGNSIALSGNYLIVGAWSDNENGDYSGAAYIFSRNPETSIWSEEAKLISSDIENSDRFGCSVSISGNFAAIGAYYDDDNGSNSGSVYIFKKDGSSWIQEYKITPDDGGFYHQFGNSVYITGNYLIAGAWQNASAYIFKFDGDTWVQEAKLTTDDGNDADEFGVSVSMANEFAIVGASSDDENGSSAGAAYVFRREETGWIQEAKLIPTDGIADDEFGASVSISKDYALVGGYLDDTEENGFNSGSAYVFKRHTTENIEWTQETKLTASDGSASDGFGWSVSLSGYYALVGAPWNDNSEQNDGKAYFYDLSQIITGESAIAEDNCTDILISPNPANDKITISSHAKHLPEQITIFDILGNKILHQNCESYTIDISSLPENVYFIEIQFDDMIATQKFIVKR